MRRSPIFYSFLPAPAGIAAAEYLFVINVRELAVLDLNAVGAVARIVDHAVLSVFLYAVHDAAHSGRSLTAPPEDCGTSTTDACILL